MKKLLILILFISENIVGQDASPLKDVEATEQILPRILIINSFDANHLDTRKNKKALFAELADSLKSYLAAKIVSLELGTPEIIEELMPPVFDSTSLLDSLFKQYDASTIVMIKSLNVFFQNTGETVERGSDGKREKTIRYDLCTAIEYVVFAEHAPKKERRLEDCEFLTDRTSSGTFSIQAGPDIVGKKKHTYKAVKRNAEKFIKYDL
jgi:hypothetical protein